VALIARAQQADHAAHADLLTERQAAADGAHLVQQRDDVLASVRKLQVAAAPAMRVLGSASSSHRVWSDSSEREREEPSRGGVEVESGTSRLDEGGVSMSKILTGAKVTVWLSRTPGISRSGRG
jgi:hypothetical protein